MPTQIVEDRTLARIALDVAGQSTAADGGTGAAVAFGRAMISLRVLGISASPEILHTLRADIDRIFADPTAISRARALGLRLGERRASEIAGGTRSMAA